MNIRSFLNKKQIKKYSSIVSKINREVPNVEKQNITLASIKASSDSKNNKIIKAMAVAKIAAQKAIGMSYYDVQLMGALALIDGKIAQMKTGEGKTLMCSAAVAANYVLGFKTHVATANEYLAQRDAETLKGVYDEFGITSAFNVSGMDSETKKNAYNADVVYSTAQEMGFDYLRDNLVKDKNEKIQPNNFLDVKAIIDEADFILIDEARTPLIISGQADTLTPEFYQQIKTIALLLEKMESEPKKDPMLINVVHTPKGDFWVDYKTKAVHLSDDGFDRLERELVTHGVLVAASNANMQADSLYHKNNLWIVEEILNALKAQHLFLKDKQYVVKDEQIVIVDENTGRLSPGRTWSDGLHQAIEAKENLKINALNTTMGTISIQNYFRLYGKISGMTGTAILSADEFEQIYSCTVVEIPTNKNMIRLDNPDIVYMKAEQKYEHIILDIIERHKKSQPILVGTTSVLESEHISALLQTAGIAHYVLNAKNHALEAQIIAQAGSPGAVTVSTSMAGRGTDIILGGNKDELIHIKKNQIATMSDLIERLTQKINVISEGLDEQLNSSESDEHLKNLKEVNQHLIHHTLGFDLQKYQSIGIQMSIYLQSFLNSIVQNSLVDFMSAPELSKLKSIIEELLTITQLSLDEGDSKWKAWRETAIASGGLCVVGCSRNESRRIDDQLRGRSGRQGDVGESIFYVSFEDSWMSAFAQSSMFQILRNNIDPNTAIESRLITSSIEKAQRTIEGMHFDNRKQLFQYDSVLDEARRSFFDIRDKFILDHKTIENIFLENIKTKMSTLADWRHTQSVEIQVLGQTQSTPLDVAMEDVYIEAKQDTPIRRRLMTAILAHTLSIKLANSEKLFTIIELSGFWDKFNQAGITQDTQFKDFVQSEILAYFSYMTEQFWVWFNAQSLEVLDNSWIDYLSITEEIRKSSSLSAMAQKNPLYEYKKACYELFSNIVQGFIDQMPDAMFDKIEINFEPPEETSLPIETIYINQADDFSLNGEQKEGNVASEPQTE